MGIVSGIFFTYDVEKKLPKKYNSSKIYQEKLLYLKRQRYDRYSARLKLRAINNNKKYILLSLKKNYNHNFFNISLYKFCFCFKLQEYIFFKNLKKISF